MGFQGGDGKLFFSRNDLKDPRLGDAAKALPKLLNQDDLSDCLKECRKTSTTPRNFVLAGYPDDEGIRINGGRLGAAQAPIEVRRALYKMTPALMTANDPATIWDLGDLIPEHGSTIESRHDVVAKHVKSALSEGMNWIGIGGGHDYGFPDADGFCQWCIESKAGRPLVINFDAHLDVRPSDRGLSSGTPFYRMLEKFPDVDFLEVGIQGHCNSRAHLEWAKNKGARVLTQEEILAANVPMVTELIRVLDTWIVRPRPVFLSIDIDGFSNSVAPGCSQSWATGFQPADFFPCLDLLASRLDMRVLGIYEVSPPLDQDMHTSKLAAQIIHRVIS